MTLRRALAVLGLTLLVCRFGGQAASSDNTPGVLRIDGRTQGTTYRLRAFADAPASEARTAEIKARVEGELRLIDELMSSWREDIETERFNRSPADVPFLLSTETTDVLDLADRIWRITAGAFDPAIGRVIRLWGFGGAPRRRDVPSENEIAAALRESGWAHVVRDGRSLVKRRSGLCIDLSGIAPGYAVDRLFELLQHEGYRSVLVEIGGEVRAGAPPPGEPSWRVGIEEPDGSGSLRATLAVRNAAVSTSGDYRAGFEVDGLRYSHILDPHDGGPIRTGLASATVVAPDSATADALATALMVLGAEKAMALVERLPDVDCLLIFRRDGRLEEVRSRGMSRWVAARD